MSEKFGRWVVRARKTVDVLVYCTNCTKDEARDTPFTFAEAVEDMEMVDYEVISVASDD